MAKTLIRGDASPLATAAAVLEGKRALIVGDAALARDMLAGWNMHVTAVVDGLSALITIDEAARQGRPFDVVLIDRHVRGETGHEVADAIRRLEKGRQIELILCTTTGHDGKASTHATARFGATLSKPLTSGALLEALTATLTSAASRAEHETARTLIANHADELEAMRADLWSGDRYTLRCRAQSLKQAASLAGAIRVLEVAALLETEAATMGQAEAFAQIERLARLFTEAAEELTARLGSVVA